MTEQPKPNPIAAAAVGLFSIWAPIAGWILAGWAGVGLAFAAALSLGVILEAVKKSKR